MNLSELLDKGDVKKIEALPPGQCRPLLDKAESDLKAAADNLESHPDWALAIAYNAMLTAGIALMASNPCTASTTTGEDCIYFFKPSKKGLSLCSL